MEKRSPVYVINIILLSISLALGFAIFFFASLKDYPSDNENKNVELLVPKSRIEAVIGLDTMGKSSETTGIRFDTIKVKRLIEDLSISNYEHKTNGEIQQSLTLNFAPRTLVFIAYQCVFLPSSIVLMIIMIWLIRRLVYEFNFDFKSKKYLWPFVNVVVLLIITAVLIIFVNNTAELKLDPRLLGGASLMEIFDLVFKKPVCVVKVITYTVSITALIPLSAIALISTIAASESKRVNDKEKQRKSFIVLKNYLNSIAFLSGLIVSGTIVGISLQRNMMAEFLTNIRVIFPDEFIAVYGVAFTFILAIFFIPTLLYMKSFERELDLKEHSDPERTSWLRIGKNTWNELKLLFSVFLPVFASILEYLLQ